eukprot:gene10456-19248_t
MDWLSVSCASESSQIGVSAGQGQVSVGDEPAKMQVSLVWDSSRHSEVLKHQPAYDGNR